LNSEKIWKIWKKSMLNNEMIWKVWKKSWIVKSTGTKNNLKQYGKRSRGGEIREKSTWKKIGKKSRDVRSRHSRSSMRNGQILWILLK
jgi:hypothetical protein